MTVFQLKYIMSDINIATTTLFWLPFAWLPSFSFSLILACMCP